MSTWQVDGKFFRTDHGRIFMRCVTYGPFPPSLPDTFCENFAQIKRAGFNSIRLYELPTSVLLDEALKNNLNIFAGLPWKQSVDFISKNSFFESAVIMLQNFLREHGNHPALVGIYVGNEIPANLVRWMGPVRVRKAIEKLIDSGKKLSPKLLFAYANYPTTEYLEPGNADFTAVNVYLEDAGNFRKYLTRLHHIAGDRPLVISEFGMDSRRNGYHRQANTIQWGADIAQEVSAAGITIYAWSDCWWNAGAEVLDWDFGLTSRAGMPKPALTGLNLNFQPAEQHIDVSVIVCTRNGRQRIGRCINALLRQSQPPLEIIVVDDGSVDGSGTFIKEKFPEISLISIPPTGLSAARNTGARVAKGEVFAFTDDDCAPDEDWLKNLARALCKKRFDAVGGPNLAPPSQAELQTVINAAPGSPSHVMLTDEDAEHLPGCNLAVSRDAFEAIGGFDIRFHTAGDDVDFCWKLHAAGYKLGFVPGAFVWHWRRGTVRSYLKQQLLYGRAERLLKEKYPSRFSHGGGAEWSGIIYQGLPIHALEGSNIYHGVMGSAPYQSVVNSLVNPKKVLPHWYSRRGLSILRYLQPKVRAFGRNGEISFRSVGKAIATKKMHRYCETELSYPNGRELSELLTALLREGWRAGGPSSSWDLENAGVRILCAMEKGECGARNLLVRGWGISQKQLSELVIATIRHHLL